MRVGALRRRLRTLPTGMFVLLGDGKTIYQLHSDDVQEIELPGGWGPKALLISSQESPRHRHRSLTRNEPMRPIERVRAQQRRLTSGPKHEAWDAFFASAKR